MPKINRTLDRAIDILQLIHESKEPLSIKEISDAMEMPVTSTFDIIHTLLHRDYLEASENGAKTYKIGSMAYRIGMTYVKDSDILDISKPYLLELEKRINSTVFLAVKDGSQIMYVNKIEASGSIRTSASLGARRELYSTGLGKSILALYSPDEIRNIYDGRILQAFTEYTTTDVETIIRKSYVTRKRGYAIDDQEGDINVCCVASAIRTNTDMIYAISTAMLRSVDNFNKLNEYGKLVAEYAFEISRKMGFLGDHIYD